MQQAPIPKFEDERLRALQSLNLLSTLPEERFDRITRSASKALNAPISTISLIDDKREYYKSRVGIEQTGGDRGASFCGHTIAYGKVFVVEDTQKDPRFADNPQVKGPPHVRFYAGVTLHDRSTRLPVGAF